MSQVWKIMKWEFMNRVKTKLFLITTFVLPFFMAGIMYLPTMLMDMEPEDMTEIGLVYDDRLSNLLERFQAQVNGAFKLQDGTLSSSLSVLMKNRKRWTASSVRVSEDISLFRILFWIRDRSAIIAFL